MNAKELVAKCLDIAKNYNTVYMWGCVGSPVTPSIIASKAAQYPNWYTQAKKDKFNTLVNKNYWGFDCVNLIKAILWGWNGDRSATYGGAKYASNKVPDVSADGMIQLCKGVTTNFKADIPIGAALWCSGHIGVYIGNGLGVECTPIWKDGVQITAVKNIGEKPGYNARQWTKWGLIPWVDYTDTTGTEEGEDEDMTNEKFAEMFTTYLKSLQNNDASPYSAEARNWAIKNSLIYGNGESINGEPNYMWPSFITREQFITLMYRLAAWMEKNIKPDGSDSPQSVKEVIDKLILSLREISKGLTEDK